MKFINKMFAYFESRYELIDSHTSIHFKLYIQLVSAEQLLLPEY